MAGAGKLYEDCRRNGAVVVLDTRILHGSAAAGICIEGWLAGMRNAMREFMAPDEIYAVFQRHADEAAKPLINTQPAKHQE